MRCSHGLLLLILFLTFFPFQSRFFFISSGQKNGFRQSNYRTHYQINPITNIRNNHKVISSFTTKNSSPHTLRSSKTSTEALSPKLGTYGSGFISTWNTSEPGQSNSTQITLPLISSGTYNFTVVWGDGQTSKITSFDSPNITHTYATAGIYTLNITGVFIGWEFFGRGSSLKLLQISHWGPLRLGNTGYYFYGARNLVLTANDSLDLNGTTSLHSAFEYCSNLGDIGTMNSWNTSEIIDMNYMFQGATSFNQSLTNWDVSHVTTMAYMFEGATSFNQNINHWKVSQVTDMTYMFADASSFNQNINQWNVSQVRTMAYMFSNTASFNQTLYHWNVSQVRNMAYMFEGAASFNQNLNNWDVSHVTTTEYMFRNANFFNQTLNQWNVSQVTTMAYMFADANSFNQPLVSWNVSHVRNMESMFWDANSFNQPLVSWNVSQVTTMVNMFNSATSFNQSLTTWDVSLVTDMTAMFAGALSFNQDLGSWNVSNVQSMSNMFSAIKISTINYDELLNSWSRLPLQFNVNFNAGFSEYNSSALAAREFLINHFNWLIRDSGPAAGFTISTTSSSPLSNFSNNFLPIFIFSLGLIMLGLVGFSGFLFVDYRKHRTIHDTKNKNGSFSFKNYLHSRFNFLHKKQKPVNELSERTLEMIDEIIKENEE